MQNAIWGCSLALKLAEAQPSSTSSFQNQWECRYPASDRGAGDQRRSDGKPVLGMARITYLFGPHYISWDSTLGLLCPQRPWIVELPSQPLHNTGRERDYGRTSQLLPAPDKRLCRMRFINRISALPEVEDREDLRETGGCRAV